MIFFLASGGFLHQHFSGFRVETVALFAHSRGYTMDVMGDIDIEVGSRVTA